MSAPFLDKNNGFNIDGFRGNFENAARNYLFYVNIDFPSGITVEKPNATYLVRSSKIPAHTIEAKEVPWQGYKYKIGGTSTIEDWTVSFTVDAKAGIYKAFEQWMKKIHNPATNEHGLPSDYMMDQTVQMLNNSGDEVILAMRLFGAWPNSLGELELTYDGNELATFEVTFSVQRHDTIE